MTRSTPLFVLMALASLLTEGCATHPADFGRHPELSPVGSANSDSHANVRGEMQPIAHTASAGASAWSDSAADLFRDARAMRVGDVITVKISIKDKAVIDNASNRSRDSTMSLDRSMQYDVAAGNIAAKGNASGQTSGGAKSTSTSSGGVNRSESIELLVAAIVVRVLPNGHLLIRGTQEVRVNFELRELTVAGIVRPRDVATDNTISYERIAEARISYGGKGRITEVQQPAWGQQLIDAISPF